MCLDGGEMADSDLPFWNSGVGIAANGGVRPQDLCATDAGGLFLSTRSRSSKYSERFHNSLETAGGDHQSLKSEQFNGRRYERELFRPRHEFVQMVEYRDQSRESIKRRGREEADAYARPPFSDRTSVPASHL